MLVAWATVEWNVAENDSFILSMNDGADTKGKLIFLIEIGGSRVSQDSEGRTFRRRL